MIKLIATDLDGTLLRADHRFSPRLYPLLDELDRRGVLFCTASGRNARTMLELFPQLKHRALMITDNGTTILQNGEVLDRSVITLEEVRRIQSLAGLNEGMHALGCGLKNIYYLNSDPSETFKSLVHEFFPASVGVDDMEAAYAADPFNRFSFYDEQSPEAHGVPLLAPLRPGLLSVPSGGNWIDVYRCDWGKGVCLAKVQQRFGISPEETLCFGDYLNDVDLMTHAYYSYAMKNAHPGLKAVCRFETKDTNEQDGVVNTIAELLGITGI